MKGKKREENKLDWWQPAFYTMLILLAATFLTILSSAFFPRWRMMQDDGYFYLRILLSGLNIALCTYLIYIYLRDYLVLRSSFTAGILLFLFAFLLYGLSSFPLLHTMMGYPPYGMRAMGPFALVPMLFSTAALLIFLKLSHD